MTGPNERSPSTPIRIPIVATEGELDQSFLDGMSLAQVEVNEDRGIDGRLLETTLELGGVAETGDRLRSALAQSPPAVLVVGPAEAVVAARPEIEASRTPVILLGGDAYTGRDLHRYLFQTSVPFRWQARVLATYLHEDRGFDVVDLLSEGPDASLAEAFA
ncbi:MAG: ABC transporter substrate-binding protein, partial [Actinomycetota bacterium]